MVCRSVFGGFKIGLLFFGLDELIFYFDTSAAWGYPNNSQTDHAGITKMTVDLGVAAMWVTYFHLGFLGWAVYAMVCLCQAYFGFRKKLPLILRSTLYPVIGERIYGLIGHAVDLPAEFGTVFGVATSLGLRGSRMGVCLNHLFETDAGTTTQVILIGFISVDATMLAVSGVGDGS